MLQVPPIPPMTQSQCQGMGGRGGLTPPVPGTAADATAAAAVVAAARELLRGRDLLMHAVAPVADRARAGGRSVGVALLFVAVTGHARQHHVAEAQTETLRVKGLNLAGLPLQEGADTF